ncbi:lipid II:glycine glycyltransferase FemX [Sneathiella aquimaris]|uniref:lipid II:glycine glycyltransferase FemX n=1 Tax=Sneathiella aquimaris TaxID=2599305 RepID=UPI00146BCA6A|nr:peptidoglycan bridge formation glycyltransferase FemA/FemB family protein [Sneathiella aquimaris]
MTDLRIDYLTEKEWNLFTKLFLDHNYRQFWAFGNESAKRLGAISEYVGIYLKDELIGMANVRIKKIPLYPTGIAYINGGPIHLKQQNAEENLENFRFCLKALTAEYVAQRNLVLRVKCSIYDEEGNTARDRVFQNDNFRRIQPEECYRTFLVDVSKTEDEIRASLHGKWRNQLNRADKNDLTVLSGTGSDLFETFEKLFEQLKEKKGFSVALDVDFYEKTQTKLPEHEKFLVQVALKNNEVLSAHVGSYVGNTAVYLLGASNPKGNELKASYLLQWYAIRNAKKLGCDWYDLGGVDPAGNKGVYHFKKGFKGTDVTAAGPYQAGSVMNVCIVSMAERAYRFLLKLRS